MDLHSFTNWTGNLDDLFATLTRELAAAGRWHELFEARLTAARARHGLSLTDAPPLDELPEAIRQHLENDYTAACREVGGLMLEAGQLREAWPYLRAAGQRTTLHAALGRVVPTDENVEELIELALYEAIDVERGYGWLLGHYGTCNAVTAIEGLASQMIPADVVTCAAVLVRHVDRELRDNLRNHIGQQENTKPAKSDSVTQLMAGRDWLFDAEASHVDSSHLATTVRYARLLTEPRLVELAAGLAEYGGRLHPSLQYAGDAPFEELYPTHLQFFRASLGQDVDAAIEYFRQQATDSDPAATGSAAIETLLVLLDRVGRATEAIETYEQLVPSELRLSPFAPRLVDLAAKSGDWDRYEKMVRERDDPVGLAIGVVTRGRGKK